MEPLRTPGGEVLFAGRNRLQKFRGTQWHPARGVVPIAAHAALWLGWDALWQVDSDQSGTTASAMQSLPEKYEYKDTRTDAEKRAAQAESDCYQRKQQQIADASAAARLQG